MPRHHIEKVTTTFLHEFRDFAVKGNAFDLATAVVIGNAFGAIVNSLVADIITPLLGTMTGNGATDVKNLALTLRPVFPGEDAQPLLLHYGAFIQTVINFFIISLSIFVFFRLITSMRRRLLRDEEEAKVPESSPSRQEELLTEIRDLLREKK